MLTLRRSILILSASLLTACNSAPNPKIAIIGGGASGLYAAHQLYYDKGISNITIFEKEDNPSASAVSYKYDTKNNETLDMGTIFIPSSSYKYVEKDDGSQKVDLDIWKPIKALIDKYQLELLPVSGGFILDAENKKIDSVAQFFAKSGYDLKDPQTAAQLADELIRIMLYLEPLYHIELFDIKDLYDMGFTLKGETIQEWGARLNFPILTHLQMWAADQAGMAPTHLSSAANVIKLTEKFRIPYFAMLLKHFGISHNDPRIADYDFIKAVLYNNGEDVLQKPTYYRFRDGYQSLWDNMSNDLTKNSKGKIKIRYNTEVTGVTSNKSDENEGQITIKDHLGNQHTFDYVFLSVRRNAALSILNPKSFPTRYALYENGTTEDPHYMAKLYKLNTENQWFSRDGVYPIYPNAKLAGTENVKDIYNCEPFYAYIVGNAKYLTTFGFIQDTETYESCKNNSFNYLVNEMGIKDLSKEDLIQENLWSLGSQILPEAEKAGMHEKMHELQGHQGLFFIGETLSGFTVPNQMEFVLKHIDDWHQIMIQ